MEDEDSEFIKSRAERLRNKSKYLYESILRYNQKGKILLKKDHLDEGRWLDTELLRELHSDARWAADYIIKAVRKHE